MGRVRIRDIEVDHRGERLSLRDPVGEHHEGVGDPYLRVADPSVGTVLAVRELAPQALFEEPNETSRVARDQVGCQLRGARRFHVSLNAGGLKKGR